MNVWPSLPDSIRLPEFHKDPFWSDYILTAKSTGGVSLHVAILKKPYLELILEGEKTIESRFSVHRRAPYERVETGDIILLKVSGGPIVGICHVAEAWFRQIGVDELLDIKKQYEDELCIEDPDFWKDKANANYASLIKIQHVRAIEPLEYRKRDQRAWVVFEPTIH